MSVTESVSSRQYQATPPLSHSASKNRRVMSPEPRRRGGTCQRTEKCGDMLFFSSSLPPSVSPSQGKSSFICSAVCESVRNDGERSSPPGQDLSGAVDPCDARAAARDGGFQAVNDACRFRTVRCVPQARSRSDLLWVHCIWGRGVIYEVGGAIIQYPQSLTGAPHSLHKAETAGQRYIVITQEVISVFGSN